MQRTVERVVWRTQREVVAPPAPLPELRQESDYSLACLWLGQGRFRAMRMIRWRWSWALLRTGARRDHEGVGHARFVDEVRATLGHPRTPHDEAAQLIQQLGK